MRNIGISKLQLLFVLLMFALTGCSGGSSNSAGTTGTTGTSNSKISASLVWGGSGIKGTAKTVALIPAGVTTIRMTVSGAGLPVVRSEFPAVEGAPITINGVFPGTMTLTVQALNASGVVLYEGFALNVVVTADSTTNVGTIQMVVPTAKTADVPCTACHETTIDINGQNLVANFKQSGHYTNLAWNLNPKFGVTGTGCAGCHGPSHNDPNPATSGRCYECHGTFLSPAHAAYTGGAQDTCGTCHQVHNTKIIGGGCLGCHSVGRNAGAAFVQDNNGVRAIVGEFAKWSHHVTGRAITNADCAVCHLEGTAEGTQIGIDSDYHMKDNKTYLRNCNTGLGQTPDLSTAGAYVWDPASPNHTLMDQFCFSCHNADGAPTAAAALAGVTGYTGTALNPFGDTMSNQYDLLLRPAVVNAYDQFDPANSSHHAVRGAKYSTTNIPAAVFTNISAYNATAYNTSTLTPTTPATIGFFNLKTLPNLTLGSMYAAGAFTAAYTPLGATLSVRDTSTLHCGDCHTVGQFKPGASVNADGAATTLAIGAHGSENEYMLRKPNGSENHEIGTANADALVCYLCHKASVYQGNFANGTTEPIYPALETRRAVGHAGVVSGARTGSPSDRECNGDGDNSQGLVGLARLVSESPYTSFADSAVMTKLTAGKYPGNGGGNIFANKCLNCHNASDKKTFAGIHGNAGNATYTTYSARNRWPATGDSYIPVQRKPYRFLPGLGNFRYNGGATPDQWTQRSLYAGKGERRGCYTLNGTSSRGTAAGVKPSLFPTKAQLSGDNTADKFVGSNPYVAGVNGSVAGDDNGILGSWGACSDHAGSSYSGVSEPLNRTIIRPLTY